MSLMSRNMSSTKRYAAETKIPNGGERELPRRGTGAERQDLLAQIDRLRGRMVHEEVHQQRGANSSKRKRENLADMEENQNSRGKKHSGSEVQKDASKCVELDQPQAPALEPKNRSFGRDSGNNAEKQRNIKKTVLPQAQPSRRSPRIASKTGRHDDRPFGGETIENKTFTITPDRTDVQNQLVAAANSSGSKEHSSWTTVDRCSSFTDANVFVTPSESNGRRQMPSSAQNERENVRSTNVKMPNLPFCDENQDDFGDVFDGEEEEPCTSSSAPPRRQNAAPSSDQEANPAKRGRFEANLTVTVNRQTVENNEAETRSRRYSRGRKSFILVDGNEITDDYIEDFFNKPNGVFACGGKGNEELITEIQRYRRYNAKLVNELDDWSSLIQAQQQQTREAERKISAPFAKEECRIEMITKKFLNSGRPDYSKILENACSSVRAANFQVRCWAGYKRTLEIAACKRRMMLDEMHIRLHNRLCPQSDNGELANVIQKFKRVLKTCNSLQSKANSNVTD